MPPGMGSATQVPGAITAAMSTSGLLLPKLKPLVGKEVGAEAADLVGGTGEGVSDTGKLRRAGVGSSLPARSRAFTSNTWEPVARPVRVAVVALANGLNGRPSSRQAKTRLPGG